MLNRIRNTVLTGVVLAGLPTAAFAHHHGFHVDVFVPAPEVVVPAPQCDVTPDRVWVSAEYRTVTERVWVEPVTTIKLQRVAVPAQYGWRDVVYRDHFGRAHIRREQVLIRPAHCDEQSVPAVVCPGHFEDQPHQELVCEGHWETPQPVTVVRPVPAAVRLEIPLPF